MLLPSFAIAFIFSLLIGLVGCAQWSRDASLEASGGLSDSGFLPAAQKSLDSVLVETVLVRFPEQRIGDMEEIWGSVDESLLEISQRKMLDSNGLRAGVLLGELPKVLRDQIETTSHDQATDVLEHAGLAADVDNRMRQLQCRAGRSKEVIVRRELTDPLTVMSTKEGVLSGNTFQKPTVLFDMRVMPHGDKQTTIKLTPEIQHGELKQAFVTTELGIRPNMQRDKQKWQELTVTAKLKPGQVLLMASTMPPKALGFAFFTTTTAELNKEYVVLLLRVAETQLDELFAPEEIAKASAMMER